MPKRTSEFTGRPPSDVESPGGIVPDATEVEPDDSSSTLSLSPEQVQKAGLANAAVGDEYEVTLRCRITSTGEVDVAAKKGAPAPAPTSGMSVEVIGYSNGKQVTNEPDEFETPNAKNSRTFKSRVLNPSDAGMM